MKDFYYILGTANDASSQEIDAAFQKLARKFQAGEEHDEFLDHHFLEIAEAYDVLRDANRRRKYDAAFSHDQKRHLAVFRLKYLNIAVTVTFLVVTALFAGYVIRSIRGRPVKKLASKVSITAPVAAKAHSKTHQRPFIPFLNRRQRVAGTIYKQPAAAVPVAAPAPAPDSTYSTVLQANITGIIYLHQSADFNSAVLAKIPDAAGVRVLQKGPVYYKIMFEGQTGYVLKTCVDKK